ncbi:MAG: S-adenosylmethionine:tRNA ribosyltransferase-isomerase [Prolixibacteraceae bacterium]|nr:S-adenosylmethionine:tRNA ribosyltransferase-isomerase [Prolixibacteraceae bacterium]
MSGYKNIRINDFNYQLSEDRIARYPLSSRDESKLLIWKNGKPAADRFKNLPGHLPGNSLLVFNNTKVIHARLHFRKETGAKVEIFCINPIDPSDHQLTFGSKGRVVWECIVGNSKKWKKETLKKIISCGNSSAVLEAAKIGRKNDIHIIEFRWDGELTFSEIIEKAGVIPIPPYLGRDSEPSDEKNYQTVYAKMDGSVAAPTAGLHFTDNVLEEIKNSGIQSCEITLHVGAGTFQPVKSETLDGHTMHHEKVVIPKSVIEKLLIPGNKIIAVGTTSVRSLESLYWLGLQLEGKTTIQENLRITQWEPYKNRPSLKSEKALKNILCYLDKTGQQEISFSTQIIIVPGYDFKIVKGIITNFHQPQSTLLLLISAFLGDDWKKVYEYALAEGFRFLSYGDSNLYLK